MYDKGRDKLATGSFGMTATKIRPLIDCIKNRAMEMGWDKLGGISTVTDSAGCSASPLSKYGIILST